MELWKLPNGSDGQVVEFTGKQLASGSSHGGEGTLRWTEVRIFRTLAGKYILQKVGRSVVRHRAGAQCASGEPTEHTFGVAERTRPCPICQPTADDADLMVEVDRHFVHVSDTAEGIVESAYSQDSEGVTYMTRVARQALLRASLQDAAIKAAFMTQKVD